MFIARQKAEPVRVCVLRALRKHYAAYATFRYGRYGEVLLFSQASQNVCATFWPKDPKWPGWSRHCLCLGVLDLAFHPPFPPRTPVEYPAVGSTSVMTGGSGVNYGTSTVTLWDIFTSEDGVPHVGVVPRKDGVPTARLSVF